MKKLRRKCILISTWNHQVQRSLLWLKKKQIGSDAMVGAVAIKVHGRTNAHGPPTHAVGVDNVMSLRGCKEWPMKVGLSVQKAVPNVHLVELS